MLSSKGGWIGTKGNSPKHDTQSPGVGQYHLDINPRDMNKMGSFGKEKRRDLGSNNNFPSPGSYE